MRAARDLPWPLSDINVDAGKDGTIPQVAKAIRKVSGMPRKPMDSSNWHA